MDNKHGVSIVIPVYNEQENILTTLGRIEKEVKIPFEVLIIYDFDEDNTLAVLSNADFKMNLKKIKNAYERGVPTAIKTGLDNSTYDAVVIVMADCCDEIEKINLMYKKISEGIDVVCGSRYMKGGQQRVKITLKPLLSRLAGLSLYVAGIPTCDSTNAFKMYRLVLFKAINIESKKGFEISMEITLKAFSLGYKISEIPVTWTDRTGGTSKFKLFKWMPAYLKWYFFGIKSLMKKF